MGGRNRIGWFTYWRGRWRLRWGYCPLCYSSPPAPDCAVCAGTYDYGPYQTGAEHCAWRNRLDALR